MADFPEHLTVKQASAYLRSLNCSIAEGTLSNMRRQNARIKGPPYYEDGGRILYRKDELAEWRRNRLVRVG